MSTEGGSPLAAGNIVYAGFLRHQGNWSEVLGNRATVVLRVSPTFATVESRRDASLRWCGQGFAFGDFTF